MDNQPLPSVLETMALSPEGREDPHSKLADLRSRCPVHRDAGAGLFFVTEHATAREILSNRSLVKDPEKSEPEAFLVRFRREGAYEGLDRREEARLTLLDLDEPDHSRVRAPFTRALYARAARMRPRIEAIVDRTIDNLISAGEFDLVAHFAVPIPVEVIAAILGVDEDRLGEFRMWSEGIVQTFNHARTPEQSDALVHSANALSAYIHETMARRRIEPKDDLITDMVAMQAEGAALSDAEIAINLTILLVGGNLTTTDLISNLTRLLLVHPEERAKLERDWSLVNAAVEEALRFDGPVDLTIRIADADMAVGGHEVRKGQAFGVSLRGANRDPAVFEKPDQFDITRKPAPHVAFGGGAHICLGAPLARMEAQIAATKLLQRLPSLGVADPNAKPQWRALPTFRGLERLDVVYAPAAVCPVAKREEELV